MERCRMVFSGSGGQGVITAAIIIAEAAVIHEDLNAVQSQSYGAAARGGATRSDIIVSDAVIHFPQVIQPNVLVCLTQEAYNAYYAIIRPGGLLLTDKRYVKTEKKVDARQVELPMYRSVIDYDRQTDRIQHLHAGSGGEPDPTRPTRIDPEGARKPDSTGVHRNEPPRLGSGPRTGSAGWMRSVRTART